MHLTEKGFRVEKSGNVIHESKVFLLGVGGDVPGIADVMNHGTHCSYYGCRYCVCRGEHVPGSSHGMYFTKKDRLRTKEELVNGDPVNTN